MPPRPLFGSPEQSVLGMSKDELAQHIERKLWEAATGGLDVPEHLQDIRIMTRGELMDLASNLRVPFCSLVPLTADEALLREFRTEAIRRGDDGSVSLHGIREMLQHDVLEAILQPTLPLDQYEQYRLYEFRVGMEERLREHSEED